MLDLMGTGTPFFPLTDTFQDKDVCVIDADWQRGCAESQIPGRTVLLPRGSEAASGRIQRAAIRHLVPEGTWHPSGQIGERPLLKALLTMTKFLQCGHLVCCSSLAFALLLCFVS